MGDRHAPTPLPVIPDLIRDPASSSNAGKSSWTPDQVRGDEEENMHG